MGFSRARGCGQGAARHAAHEFREALSLWLGPTLTGLQLESPGRDEVVRLDELRLAALMDRIDCDLALGRHEQVLGPGERPRPRAPVARASPRPADARPLPRRSSGRRTRRVCRGARHAAGGARPGAERRAAAPAAGGSSATTPHWRRRPELPRCADRPRSLPPPRSLPSPRPRPHLHVVGRRSGHDGGACSPSCPSPSSRLRGSRS
jgi:Bacterial transcriptional activator domain